MTAWPKWIRATAYSQEPRSFNSDSGLSKCHCRSRMLDQFDRRCVLYPIWPSSPATFGKKVCHRFATSLVAWSFPTSAVWTTGQLATEQVRAWRAALLPDGQSEDRTAKAYRLLRAPSLSRANRVPLTGPFRSSPLLEAAPVVASSGPAGRHTSHTWHPSPCCSRSAPRHARAAACSGAAPPPRRRAPPRASGDGLLLEPSAGVAVINVGRAASSVAAAGPPSSRARYQPEPVTGIDGEQIRPHRGRPRSADRPIPAPRGIVTDHRGLAPRFVRTPCKRVDVEIPSTYRRASADPARVRGVLLLRRVVHERPGSADADPHAVFRGPGVALPGSAATSGTVPLCDRQRYGHPGGWCGAAQPQPRTAFPGARGRHRAGRGSFSRSAASHSATAPITARCPCPTSSGSCQFAWGGTVIGTHTPLCAASSRTNHGRFNSAVIRHL
jgi:hypothetical protein